MDLFPKDYRKNNASFSGLNSGSSAANFWQRLKGHLSSGGSDFSVSSRTRETWLRLLVIFSGTVFLLVLLSWGGLIFYKKVLTDQIDDLKKQHSEVFVAADKEQAAKIVDLDQRAALTQLLLKNHIYSSNVFQQLSKSTVPKVQWQTLNFSVPDSRLTLRGVSASYSSLAKQMLALQEDGFYNLEISDIQLDKSGGVAFIANFNFDQKILQKHE